MGNCETCQSEDKRTSINLVLKDGMSAETDTSAKLFELPECCPPAVRETYQKLGPFEMFDLSECEIPEPRQLEGGILYQGQWVDGEKEGFGRQVWPDGSIYEGMWQKGMAHG